MEEFHDNIESTSRGFFARALGRLGLTRFTMNPMIERPLTEEEKAEDKALEKALDDLGFEPENWIDRFRFGVGNRPERSRGGGMMIEPVKGAPPSPEVVSAIHKMSQPGISLFDRFKNPSNSSGENG